MLLEETARFAQEIGSLTSKPEMKRFQQVMADPLTVHEAFKGLRGEDVAALFGGLGTLGPLQGKLATIANLKPEEQTEVIAQLRRVATRLESVAKRIEE